MEASAITGPGTPSMMRTVRAVAVDRLFELAAAVSWALVGVSWIPDAANTARHSPVGVVVAPWPTVWSALYVIGALCVVIGLFPSKCNLRVAGLLLLATGLVMEGTAAAFFQAEPRVLIYFVYAFVCAFRAGVAVWAYGRRVA